MRGILTLSLVLYGALYVIPVCANGQEDEKALHAAPALVLEMRDSWIRYQELDDTGDQESADHLADRIIELRHRAGMLGNSELARAFAMRGWRQHQDGKLEAALRKYRVAVNLEPSAREYRVALAGALAARNPLDFGTYLPEYIGAYFGSFETMRGRYLLLADSVLWIALTLFTTGALWMAAMLLRHLRSFHHTLAEILRTPFTGEIAQVLAVLIIVSPLFFGVSALWWILGLAAASWAFQSGKEKAISIAALVFLWLGASMIALSGQMAAGLTSPDIQAVFAADRLDADEDVVQVLEKQLEGELSIIEGRLQAPSDYYRRLEFFLYAQGLRKLGRSDGLEDLDILEMFMSLQGDDSLGRLAAINAANIQLERENFTSAEKKYESALDDEASRPYALYNLWRLNNLYRNPGDALEFWDDLQSESRTFARRFRIDEDRFRPELIDAPLHERQLNALIEHGLEAANGGTAARTKLSDLFLRDLFGSNNLWAVITLVGMVVGRLIFGYLGVSAICPSCGKIYCRRCGIEPGKSTGCQACSALRVPKVALDADLIHGQRKKIERHKKWKLTSSLVCNILVPGIGSALRGRAFLGSGLLLCWGALAALVYANDRMPRAESLPFFSHWTLPVWLLLCVLALIAYPIAVWQSLKEKSDGTDW